jgi:hypothetical protein
MQLGRLIGIAGLIGFAAVSTALAADVTFDASGTFADGSTLGGTIVIDTATGVVDSTGVDLTVTGGTSDDFTFDELSSSYNYSIDSTDNFYEINLLDSAYTEPAEEPQIEVVTDPILTLTIPIGSNTTLAGFTGSASLCSFSLANCEGGNYYSDWEQNFSSDSPAGDPFLSSGSLTSSAAPEPASLLLLAGPVTLLIRRQLRKAQVQSNALPDV